jgi:hypothetical protein
MFHGFVYDCENAKGVGRKETLTGLELEVCEVGYCDN